MEGISLNQYISNYREIIMKLKGIDEFQILRGFMRDLSPDYEAYVEPKQPKDLAEALKYAQIYDDITRRSKGVSRKGKEKESFGLERKFFKSDKESGNSSEFTKGQGGRWKKKPRQGKPKNQSKQAKKEQYDKARKDNLCFNCFEAGHTKAACPKLGAGGSSSDAKKDGKSSRQVHTIQRLPLHFDEFSEVVVSHMSSTHECSVTQAMWQPSVGPHDLVRLYGSLGGRRVSIMIDDGATHNFLNYALVKRLKLPQTKSDHEYVVHLANGQDSTVWDTVVTGVNLHIQDYVASLDFQVMHLARADIYLGREWLYNLGPTLSRSYQDNSLEFVHEGKKVRLQGESQVPAAPLISSLELCRAAEADQIDQVYIVKPLHSFLSVDESKSVKFVGKTNDLSNVSVVETNTENVFQVKKQKTTLVETPVWKNLSCLLVQTTKPRLKQKKLVDTQLSCHL